MTTSRINANRGEDLGEFNVGVDGAIGTEVRLIADKSLTKSEVLTMLRRAKERLLQIKIPRV